MITTQEYKEIIDFCDRKFKALQNVERITGMRSMQSVCARGEWWGAADVAEFIHERFLNDQYTQGVFDKSTKK